MVSPCDGELHRIAQRRAEWIVPDLGGVDAVGDRGDRLAHRLLGTALQHGGERFEIVDAVLAHERGQALGADRVRGDEGMHVAQHLRGIAHVLGEQREQVLVRHARAEQLHRRDLDAFLENLACLERVLRAADVAHVTDRADEADELTIAEHRRQRRDVEQVPGAEPRIVGDQHVARHQRLGGIFREQRLHGTREAEIEHRHRARRVHQRLTLRVEQLAGEILRFRDDERERRADHGEPHLVHDGDEPAPHDFE